MVETDNIHQSPILRLPDGAVQSLRGHEVRCPACGNTQPGPVWAHMAKFDIVTCPRCHSLHLSPLPDPDSLHALYQANYFRDADQAHGYRDYKADRSNVENTYHWRLSNIARVVTGLAGRNGQMRVHEIGPALGYGLPIAQALFGATVSASDISAAAVEACRDAGYRALISDHSGRCALAAEEVDLLYLFDVIEHLTDLRPFLAWLGEIIRPGGFLALTTPDMAHPINRLLGRRSPSIKIPQHVVYFSGATLDRLFAPAFERVFACWDWQRVDMALLTSRLRMILGLKDVHAVRNSNHAIWVPNGMRLFVYRKWNTYSHEAAQQ